MSLSKMIMSQSSNQGTGGSLDVDDVFSTFLYDGNSSTQTITNNIDLSNEGGLVWIKSRTDGQSHELVDTVRGNTKFIRTNSTTANRTSSSGDVTGFTSSGFSLGASTTAGVNNSSNEYVSWTWRKAPKYFDIVTYTGNGTAGRTISHSLELVPGMIWVKRTDSAENWTVWHRNLQTNSSGETTQFLKLNSSDAVFPPDASVDSSSPPVEDVRSATSTTFTVGNDNRSNANGGTYVAYVFAHHNSDGGFGVSGDQDIIKCGSFTGNGGTQDIDVGFEPQWVMLKNTGNTSNWIIVDVMRDFIVDSSNDSSSLRPNTTDSESNSTAGRIGPRPNGFGFISEGGGDLNGSYNFIYMAIRRGPLAVPTDATKVFAVQDGRGASKLYTAGFPVDMFLQGNKNGDNWQLHSRLTRGKVLATDSTSAETDDTFYHFDDQTGIVTSSGGGSALSILVAYMWKRAPSYFDVVAYTGTGSARTQIHNLGAVPEMIWVKGRSQAENWAVYHKDVGATKYLQLNTTAAEATSSTRFNDTTPTSSVFSLGADNEVNMSGQTFVAYLFATVAGVSKVGSYTGTGNTQTIDCGFTNGARFVLVKNTTSSGFSSTQRNWLVFDSARGIVSGNEPYLYLNANSSEQTGSDFIDPHSSGFQLTNAGGNDANGNGGTYIFYAIA